MLDATSDDDRPITGAVRLVRDLLDFLLPLRCAGCDREPPSERGFCGGCEQGLAEASLPRCSTCGEPFAHAGRDHPCLRCVREPPPFRMARAPLIYGGPLADAIRRMKYANRPDLAGSLAPLLADEARALPEVDVVVPVPLAWRKLFSRGYNQSALLARSVAQGLRLPMDTGVLRRIGDAGPLAGRARTARREAVRGAFVVRHPERVRGKRILLVDDVLTTGATAAAASRVLCRAGARSVVVLTLARTGEPR